MNNNKFIDTPVLWNLVLVCVCIIVWISVHLLSATPFPFDYDSTNYALGIWDKFDIGKCQPHAFGYIFHIMSARVFLPFIKNLFILQQAQSILYLLIAVLCFIPWQKKVSHALLIFATMPLLLFFTSVPVIHAASLAASALLAKSLFLLHERKINPVVPVIILFTSIGFRQDLGIFLGPVLAFALLRNRCTIRQWTIFSLCAALLTLSWYLPTSLLSKGLSPWKEANVIVRPFLESSSIIYGASLFSWARSVLRFLIYLPGVLGPGGIILAIFAFKSCDKTDHLYLFFATAPFMIYGFIFYFGFPNYYATIIAFFFVWISNCKDLTISPMVTIVSVLLNVLYFSFAPVPQYEDTTNYSNRRTVQSVKKQLSYLGANGRPYIQHRKNKHAFIDSALSRCECFYDTDKIEYGGIPYHRIWKLMSMTQWGNTYGDNPDSADCIIRYVKPGETPDLQSGNVGIWYKKKAQNQNE